jgi:hypothetical protein
MMLINKNDIVTIPVGDLINFISKYISVQPKVNVFYPPTDQPYRIIVVTFKKNLSEKEVKKVYGIFKYFGELKFLGKYNGVSITSRRTGIIFMDESLSNSSNPRSHEPLETLLEFLVNGTPIRKDNTRAHEGIGPLVQSIVAQDY